MANDDSAGDVWAKELVKRIGRAIKDARGGKSAAWLSARTEELGYRVSPTVIAKLDSGHRGTVLGVAELIVLAAALDAPVVALLYPDLPDGEVETLPGRPMPSIDAVREVTGEGECPDTDSARLLNLSRKLFEARRIREELDEITLRLSAEGDADAGRALDFIRQSVAAGDHLIDLTRQLAKIPGSTLRDHA